MDDCRRCNEDSLMPESYVCVDCQIAELKARVKELEVLLRRAHEFVPRGTDVDRECLRQLN